MISLRKISIAGGAAVEICETSLSDIPGASWGANDTIVFSAGFGEGLLAVSASGGKPRTLTTIDPARGESAHMWPQILPDNRSVLFTVWTLGKWEDARIEVVSLESGERREITRGGTYARYLPSGHLVYARAGTLLAVPFDLGRLEVTGNEVPVLPDLLMNESFGSAFHAVSNTGTLVYLPGGERVEQTRVLRVDRRGSAERLIDQPTNAAVVDLSSDGRLLAITMTGAPWQNWTYDLDTANLRQFTFEGDNLAASWTPDGTRLTFNSNIGDGYDLVWKRADGSGAREILLPAGEFGMANIGSWTPDGDVLLLGRRSVGGGANLYELSLEPEPVLRLLLETESTDVDPVLSPDGRWLAYFSNNSGRFEIYVVAYPEMDRKTRVSTDGGIVARWRENGRELFYVNEGRLYAVPVTTGDMFVSGEPVVLFEEIRVAGTTDHEAMVYEISAREDPIYDVFPDGEHFVWVVKEPDPDPSQLRVVLNWFEELKRLAPSSN